MKIKINILCIALFLFIVGIASSCKDKTNQNLVGDLTIEFEHVWDSDAVSFFLDSSFIQTKSNDTISIHKMQFYVSNIGLIKSDGTIWKEENSYHLVNPTENVLYIKNIPKSEYKSIFFTIGIDSLHNCKCIQTGDLDTNKGMFHDWNLGYTFIQVEGTYDVKNAFKYDLGGCSKMCNCIRNKSYTFPMELLNIRPTAVPEIHMMLKVANLWDDGVSLKSNSQIPIQGNGSSGKTDLFSAGLTLEHIHNN